MTKPEPIWDDLAGRADAPSGWYSQRVHPEACAVLFVALLKPGDTRALLLEVDTYSVPSAVEVVNSIGFEVRVEPIVAGPHGSVRFALVLRRPEFAEVFAVLVEDVIAAVAATPSQRDAVRALAARLRVWQAFFRGAGPDGLGREAVCGLVGELLVLRDHVLPAVGPRLAVQAWLGPIDGVQDFRLPAASVEVKSTARRPAPPFNVTGLTQLDEEPLLRLLLAHVQLDLRPGGASLPAVVAMVRAVLRVDAAALTDFDDRLTAAGYLDVHAERYETVCYECASVRFFDVVDDFPRIKAADVRPGILDVTYTVSLLSCEDFEIDGDAAISALLGGLSG